LWTGLAKKAGLGMKKQTHQAKKEKSGQNRPVVPESPDRAFFGLATRDKKNLFSKNGLSFKPRSNAGNEPSFNNIPGKQELMTK
jgi:hypothetical protein